MKLLNPITGTVLSLLLGLVLCMQAQAGISRADPVALRIVLKTLSDHYHVHFLYEENTIGDKQVTFNARKIQGKKIDEVLTAMLHPAGLGWMKIDSKNYSIFPLQAVTQKSNPVNQQLNPGLGNTATGDTLGQSDRVFKFGGQTLKEVKILSSTVLLQQKGDRYVLNVEKSIIGEGSMLSELVSQLPGVQLDKDGKVLVNGRSGISIFIDGKPTLLSLDGILSSGIEKIELISNPSAKYESAGIGGIINVIRRKNRKHGLNGTATLGYGQGRYDRYNGSFNLGFKNEHFNLFVNHGATVEKTYLSANAASDFFNATQKTGTLDADNFHIRNQQTFIPDMGLELYLSQRTTLTLSGNGQIRNNKQRSDSFTGLLGPDHQLTGGIGFVNNQEDVIRNYSSGAHLSHQLDTSGRELTADLDYSNYNNRSVQDINNTSEEIGGILINSNNLLLNQKNRLNIYSVKTDYIHPLNTGSKLETGIKSSYVHSESTSDFYDLIKGTLVPNPSRSNNFNYQESINAAYLLYSGGSEQLTYQGGIRVEHTNGRGNQLLTNQFFQQEYTKVFPSLTISYQVNPEHSIKLSSGRKIDRPAYQDLNPLRNFVNATAYIQGDPNLKPQMAYNNEIGYAYKNKFFFNLGQSMYTNYMTYWVFPEKDPKDQSVDVVVSRPVNISRASAYNANILLLKKIKPWWNSSSSFTVFYNNYKGVINNYPINNQGMLSFMFSTNHTLAFSDKLSAEANFRYAGKSQIGSSVYQPNSNLSFGIKTMLLSDRAWLTFNVTDIFHNQNYRWVSDTGSIIESRNVTIDSRVYKLNFSYRFGRTGNRKINTGNGAEEERNRARSN